MPPPDPALPQPEPQDVIDGQSRLAELVRQYARLVRHVVRTVGGFRAAADAEDIEQAVYLGLWQQVRREQAIEHPASYVYKAAVRETVRIMRRAAARTRDEGDDVLATRPSPGADPEQTAMTAESVESLRLAVEALPPDRARAVRAHLQGLSVQEIMALHGWTYQKSRNLVARGMADLRTALRERGVA